MTVKGHPKKLKAARDLWPKTWSTSINYMVLPTLSSPQLWYVVSHLKGFFFFWFKDSHDSRVEPSSWALLQPSISKVLALSHIHKHQHHQGSFWLASNPSKIPKWRLRPASPHSTCSRYLFDVENSSWAKDRLIEAQRKFLTSISILTIMSILIIMYIW